MSPGNIFWTAVLAVVVIFLIVKTRKEIKRAIDNFLNGVGYVLGRLFIGLGYILLFVLIVAIALGAIWVVVAVVHWAWRHS
jgi:ABC-type Fe3+ transport system permease subunit